MNDDNEHLKALLLSPSVENWKEIIKIGKMRFKMCSISAFNGGIGMRQKTWTDFEGMVSEAVACWPREIPRDCPDDWPKPLINMLTHKVLETSTYGHYITKICNDPRLLLDDGTQAVWLERRFTGGVVPASIAKQAVAQLWEAVKSSSVPAMINRVKEVAGILTNSVRNTGKIGTADITGGLTLEYKADVYRIRRVEVRLEIEIKVGDGKQRDAQAVRQASVQRRGGCYILAHSVEEAVQAIVDFRASAFK